MEDSGAHRSLHARHILPVTRICLFVLGAVGLKLKFLNLGLGGFCLGVLSLYVSKVYEP